MTPKQRDKMIKETHDNLHYLRYEMKVNGVDGTQPVFGIENGMEYIISNQKKTNATVVDLMDITKNERDKRDRRRMIEKLLALYHVSQKFDHLKKYWFIYMLLGSALGGIFKFLKPIIETLQHIKP